MTVPAKPYLPADAERDLLLLDQLACLAPINREGHVRAQEASARLLADIRERAAASAIKDAVKS